MALVDSQEVTLAISAQTSGQAGVSALADKVDSLARSGGAAAPEIARIAQEIQRLGQQQIRIDGLEQAIAAGKETWKTLSQARHEVQVLDKALADARGAGASAEAIRILDKELRAANAQLASAQKAWTRQKSVLAAARAEAAGMGIDTRNIGAAQQKLAADIEAANRRIQSASANTGAALQNAFEKVGVRSAQVIEQEILDVERALQRIASEGKVTGREFDRVWAAGQERIGRLKGELNGTTTAVEKVGTATNAVSSGLTRLAAALGGMQAARAFLDANVELEQLRRGLTAVTGDAGLAEAELGRLRNLADTLGVSVGALGKSWIGLAASTRGSTLEGEASRRVFDAVASSMAKLGKSTADTEGALYAVGQMASKGVVSMEELRLQLGERLPGALDAMASGLNISKGALIDLVGSGQLLAEDALPALARGLEQTFGSSQKQVDGFAAAWQRFKNTLSETAQTLGDLGIMDALASTAEAAATAVEHVAAAFMLVGKQVGITVGAIATFDLSSPIESVRRWWQALGEAEAEVKAKLNGIGSAATQAAVDTQGAATAGQQAATQFAAAAPAIQATATAFDSAAAAASDAAAATTSASVAAQQAGGQAHAASTGWVALNVAYGQALKGASAHTSQMTKLAEAVKAEGEASIRNAELTGSEVALLEARANAAARNAEASQSIAAARAAELATLQSQLLALQEEGAKTGELTEAKRNQLASIQSLIDQKNVEVQKSREVAQALLAESQAANDAAFGIEAAFRRMGVASAAALKKSAEDARRDFNLIRSSGEATARDLSHSFAVYAEKAIAANGGVASSALKAEAAMYKVRIESDASGRSVVRSMSEAATATGETADAAERAVHAYRSMAAEAEAVADSMGRIGPNLAKGPQREDYSGSASSAVLSILNRAEQLGGLEMRKQFEEEYLRRAKRQGMRVASFGGADYADYWNKVSSDLDRLQIEKERTTGRYESNAPRVVERQPREQVVTHRVEIGHGPGARTTINTASQQDADALLGLIKRLQDDATRS